MAASLAKLTALQLAVTQGSISQEEYDQVAKPFFEYLKERANEKRFLTKHRRLLEVDINEELDKLMRRVILIIGGQDSLEIAVILTLDLKDATIETAKKREQVDDPKYEDSKVESDEEMKY